MKIDYLFEQLHAILENVRFQGRLILAMGSALNVKNLQNYLKCYGIEIQAILDNNKDLSGKWRDGLKTYTPEHVLEPFNDKALILVFSPKYLNQMREQLCTMGYKENKHFFLLKDYRTREDSSSATFQKYVDEAKTGVALYKQIKKKYGDVTIVITRGATGDVFLNGLYLKEYLRKKNIDKYVLAGDAKGLDKISKLFGVNQVEVLSFGEAEALQQCYKFWLKKDVIDVFMWQGSLHFNRCQTRMHKEFNFLETYSYYTYEGLVDRKAWNMPAFKSLSQDLKKKYDALGIKKGKTVILSPFAYSVRSLPGVFWEGVTKKIKEKGYQVLVSINPNTEINPFDEIDSVFFPFDESEAILTYSGFFLGLRSGFCDIVSMVPCKQVILYPEEMQPIDYAVHRSDKIFSGFEAMGYDVSNIVEISSSTITDIVFQPFELMYNSGEIYHQLEEEILKHF